MDGFCYQYEGHYVHPLANTLGLNEKQCVLYLDRERMDPITVTMFVELVQKSKAHAGQLPTLAKIYATQPASIRKQLHWMLYRPERITESQILSALKEVAGVTFASIDTLQGICNTTTMLELSTLYDMYQSVLIPPLSRKRKATKPIVKVTNPLNVHILSLLSQVTLDVFKTILTHWIQPFQYDPSLMDCGPFCRESTPMLPHQPMMCYQPVKLQRLIDKKLDLDLCSIEQLVEGVRVLVVVNGQDMLILKNSQLSLTAIQMDIETPILTGYTHYILDGVAHSGVLTVYDVQFAEVDVTLTRYGKRREFLEGKLQITDRVKLSTTLSTVVGDVIIKKRDLIYKPGHRSIYKIQKSLTFTLAAVACVDNKIFLAVQNDQGFVVVGKTNLGQFTPPIMDYHQPSFVTFKSKPNDKDVGRLQFIQHEEDAKLFVVACSAITSGGNLRLPRLESESTEQHAVQKL